MCSKFLAPLYATKLLKDMLIQIIIPGLQKFVLHRETKDLYKCNNNKMFKTSKTDHKYNLLKFLRSFFYLSRTFKGNLNMVFKFSYEGEVKLEMERAGS